MDEVRLARLRPAQIIKRRNDCPVAYIPLGTLEWHGLHDPLGADGLQAEEMAVRCARLGGGVVFPTVWYGESRLGSLLETDPKFGKGVIERLGLDSGQMDACRFPYTDYQQIEHYQHHLVHILTQVASYGYSLAAFAVGHYPLLDHAKSAILSYNQWVYDKPWNKMTAMAFADFRLLGDLYENPGDHAGAWETSHLLASDPETVDLSQARKDLQWGIMTTRDPQGATAEFGNEIFDALAQRAVKLVEQHLKNPRRYSGHGMPVDVIFP